MLIKLVSFISFFVSISAYAAVSNISVNLGTVSAYVESGETKAIYGAFGGSIGECAGAPSTNSTCNSCSGLATFAAPGAFFCNERGIHPSLELRIEFSVSEVPSGAEIIARMGTNTTITPSSTSTTLTPNSTLFIQIPWGSLCNAGGVSSNCNTGNFSATLSIGVSDGASSTTFASEARFNLVFYAPTATGYVDECLVDGVGGSGEGFCAFTVKPGDAKVFVKDIQRASLGPVTGVRYTALRVYYAEGDSTFASIPIGGGSFQDLTVKDISDIASGLDRSLVTGLQNGVTYSFSIASVDQTGTVSGFMSPADLNGVDHSGANGTPSEVIGLLDEQKCFIATAAYGSAWEPEVKSLRQFRSQVLMQSALGRQFVSAYYKYSPPVAQFIADKPWLRAAVRFSLTPAVWLSERWQQPQESK